MIGLKMKKKKMQCSMKAKTIFTIAIGFNEFLCVSHYETSKEMRETLQVTHEGTNVKKEKMNTLTHEY